MKKYREAVVKLLGTRARRVVALVLTLAVVLVSVPTVILPFLAANANETVSGTDALSDPVVTASDTGSMRLAGNVPMLLASGQTELSVSGVWDIGSSEQGHENIAFGSSETATISHDSNHASEQINVRITANFPENASDLQLKIYLKPGLMWLVNGESTIPKTALDSVSTLQEETTFVKPLGNGAYTYKFKDGITSVDVDIVVEKNFWTNFPSISDAITAEVSCTLDGTAVKESTSLTTLLPQQFEQTILRRSTSAKTKAGEQVSVRNGLRVGSHLTSAAERDRYRVYEYIQFTINAPSEVTYVGVHTNDSSEGSPNKYWQMVGEPEVLGDGTTNYTFRAENIYSMYFSSTHYWIFPESMIGQSVKLITTDFRWKVYGDDTEGTVPSGTVGTATVEVVDPNVIDERTEVTGNNYTVFYDEDAPDALYQLSAWSMRNAGTDPSAPKVVELEFDTEKLGVVGLDLLTPYGKKPTTVWFRTEGSDEWQQKDISLPVSYNGGVGYLYHTFVRNIDLGLSEDTYLSAIKYELDYVDNNGTSADPSDDFRYGIPAGMSTVGYGSIYAPIVGVVKDAFLADTTKVISTVRVYDKVEDGEDILNDTGKVDITTRYGTALNNYIGTVGTDIITAEAGDTLTFNTTINAYWSSTSSRAFIVGFHPYPVIYIRDETGEGISNVKLTNGLGVELFSEYPGIVTLEVDHIETVDHNGDGKFAKVYKIDTTGLKNMTAFEDRYAACIGACDISANIRDMKLTYSLTTSSAYSDGQTVHYAADAVYVTDEDMAERTQRNKRNLIADEFDVDGDGLTTTDKSIVAPNAGFSPGYYIISARSDVSVSAGAKKASDTGDYTKWDGSGNYIQMEPGEIYNIRNSILNSSGVTTSTEDSKMTYVYIPVPKEGQQWGQANSGIDGDGNATSTFAFSTKLSGAVKNPAEDVFTISYGTVDTSIFNAGNSVAGVGQTIKTGATVWSDAPSDSTNCVRIAVSGMEPDEVAKHFVLPLVADENADTKGINIFSAIYYQDITNVNGNHFSGWYTSDRIALQVARGVISGRVWEDTDGDGLQDAGEPGIKGVAVSAVELNSGDSLQTTTDTDGKYSFAELPSGKYTVSFADSRMKDYVCSPKNVGSDTKLDSDGSVHSENASGMLSAQIIAFDIPIAGVAGNAAYSAEYMDVGLTPCVYVSYEWSGDIPDGATKPEKAKMTTGTAYSSESVAAVKGYTFDGWYTDAAMESKYVDSTVLTDNITLYGEWTINSYDVTYQWSGAPSGVQLPETETVDFNTKYTAEMPTAVTGYTFDGWYTDEALTAKFTDGTAIEDDTDLYGEWTLNSYTIKLDANGGEGTMADLSAHYGEEKALPENTLTREGYQFIGWSTDSAATEAMYEDKATVKNLTAEDGETVTLYAVWLKELTVTASASEGGTVSPETATVLSGDDLELTITTESGYYLKAITINGKSGDLSKLSEANGVGTFTLEALTEDTEVLLTFAAQPTIAVCSIDMGDEFWETDTITFTANGYWMTAREGAVKYVPTNWHHADPSGDWDGKDDSGFAYTDSFKQPKGEYTLKVEFAKYIYTSGTWVESGTETLEHDYIVKAKKPSGGSADGPKTGDSYIGMVIALNLLLLAALAVAYVVQDRRKQRAAQK